MVAERNPVLSIARGNISVNFRDDLLTTLRFMAGDTKATNDMTCNRTKGKYLLAV